MGHVNPKWLGSLLEHVVDIDHINFLMLQSLNYTTCNFSSITRIINQDSSKRADQRLERVHTYIWGLYWMLSIEKHIYFVFFIDNLMRKSWLIPMKTQKELSQHINNWQTAMALQTGVKIVIYQCNNAKKYQKLERLVYNDEIWMEYTTAYILKENRVAKRFNHIIVQKAQAMLIWSKLLQKFWTEIVCIANYLWNLLSSSQDNLSPNKLWDSYKFNVNHIWIFGCIVYVHISSKNRAKLDQVLFQKIFVGYHSNKQVRVYNPETNWVQ